MAALTLRDPYLLRWLVAFVALLILLGLTHEWVNPWLDFRREEIVAGQWWRLYTAHLVHLNVWHMLMNVAGFLLCVWFFVDIYSRRLLLLWLVLAPLWVSVLMLWVDGATGPYAGLSGILHGWLVLALLRGFRTHPWLHLLVLGLVAGRLVWEQLPGYDVNYLNAWIDGSVYVNAHLYGALSGVVLALFSPWMERVRLTHP